MGITGKPWNQASTLNNLYPIFRQNADGTTVRKLTLVVESKIDQKVEIRWQHTQNQKLTYKSEGRQTSYLCNVYFGPIKQ